MLKNLPLLFGLQENKKYNEVGFPSISEASRPKEANLLSFVDPNHQKLFDSNENESKVSWSNQKSME